VLSFAYKRFDRVVPEPGNLDNENRTILEADLSPKKWIAMTAACRLGGFEV
jgi:hypothetical protein